MKSRKGKGNKENRSNDARSYSRKGYKGGPKDKRSRDYDTSDTGNYSNSDRLSSLNDISWYTRNPILTQTAGSFPFPYRPGMGVQLGGNQNSFLSVPGALTLRWIPSIGKTQYPTDPANIAGKELYAKVREKFSGTIDADAPDFVIYLLALDSIFSYIGMLKRLYRVMAQYSPDNRFMPRGLFSALGFNVSRDFDALLRDRIKLCQNINELVGMTKKFHCPAVFDLMNRHYWMNDNVYTDAATIDSQMYCFVQAGFYQYAQVNTPAGVLAGGLSMKQTPFASTSTDSLCDVLFNFGLTLIRALAESDDAYLISGYLSRAFEGTPDFVVDYLPINELFQPVYQEEVLSQIENASWISNNYIVLPDACTQISQDPSTNSVLCTMTVDSAATGYDNLVTAPVIISSRSIAPTAADCVIMTRLKSYSTQQTVAATTSRTIYCGTECVVSCEIRQFNFASSSGGITVLYVPYLSKFDAGSKLSDGLNALFNGAVLANFDWHPLTLVDNTNANSGVTANAGYYVMGDIHNVTTITLEQLQNLNTVCIYSEFNAFGIN